ncbi:MAG: site-specific integrase [Victivallaceae bacterium]|nr:site-specific integrase [Victivallaceae bacterium]
MAINSIKLSKGTIYQKKENGNYYYRYQVNGQRKAVSLETKNQKTARKKAEETIPLITASSSEVIAAHIQSAKGLKRKQERLMLSEMWDVYAKHPDRARPKSQKIINVYNTYLQEFLTWLNSHHPNIQYMDEIRDTDDYNQKVDTSVIAEYAEYLRTLDIAVDTHNKKISRPAHIFKTLSKYLDAPSPWENRKLRRSRKEESGITQRRRPFPANKELEIFEALKPSSPLKILNKAEIEVLCYLLKYTGQRQKDCVNLSWNNINMERRRLNVTQEKTGKKVSIPIALELETMLKKAMDWKVNDKVLPKTAERYARKAKDGTDTGVNLINKQLLNVIKYVGLEPSVDVSGRKKKVTVYGVHSFRHGFASHCAEKGIPRAVCASILGADTSIIDSYYVHIGEEAQEKAIMSLSANNKTSDHERIEKALALIDSCQDKTPLIIEIEKVLRN